MDIGPSNGSTRWKWKRLVKHGLWIWKGQCFPRSIAAPYQSCASPGCHGIEWQDDMGQTWTGVSLYMLVGEVDDGDTHSDYAYNEEFADAGYSVDVIGSDGYTVTFDSLTIKKNGNIILAYLVNNAELPDKYYPLRLGWQRVNRRSDGWSGGQDNCSCPACIHDRNCIGCIR